MSTARAACRRCSFFGYVTLPAKLIQYRARRTLERSRVAAEAMDHDALRRTLIQDSKDLGPRVADVDDHRLPGLVRERDVRLQRPDLVFFARSHAEEVQAALPDGHHPRVVEQLLDPGARRLVEVPGIVGMHPRRGEDLGIESASSRDVADVAGSTPTHSRRSTPAARAASTTSEGSRSTRNRWQWVSTTPLCTGSSGFGRAIGAR